MRILKRQIDWVDLLFLFWIVLWIVPSAALIPGYNYVWLFFQIIWFAVIFKNYHILSGREKQFFVAYVIAYALMAFECLTIDRSEILHSYVDLFQIPFIYFVFCYFWRNNKIWTMNILIAISLLIFSFVAVKTAVALIDDPFASRAVYVSGSNDSQDALMASIGGYNFIYAIMLLSILLFCAAFTIKEEKILSILSLALAVLFSAVVVLSNFFTATVLLLFGAVMFISCRKKKRIMPFVLIVLLLIPSYKYIATIILDGASLVVQEEGRTYERLQEIKNSIAFDSKVDEDVNTRVDVKKKSVDTFLENPILGAIIRPEIKANKNMIIGNHSTLLDTFAIFGMIIGVIIVRLFIMPFIQLRNVTHNHELKTMVYTIGLVFILLMYNNNLTASVGFVAFFVFPFILNSIKSSSSEIKEKL